MKRSSQAVLALVVMVLGFGLAVAPAAAVAAPKPKAFVTTAAPAAAVWSQPVRLVAAITPKGGGQPKGGTVTFRSDGLPVGTAVATTRNTTLTTANLPVGVHVITADYSGDAVTAPSTSTGSTTVTVTPAPTGISLRATQDPVPYDERAEIKATVLAQAPAAPGRRPTGSVTFTADGCITATVGLNANGVATWRPWLCPGDHEITAVYQGSAQHAGSETASPLTLTVEEPGGEDDVDLDQENPGPPSAVLPISDDGEASSRYAQTFTAGRSGRLYAVDLLGGWTTIVETAPTDLQISIQTLDDEGAPTGSILASGVLATSVATEDDVDSYHVDLSTPAGVDEGETYALVVEVSAPQTPEAFGIWFLAGSGGDAYPDGTLLQDADGGGWLPFTDPDVDLMFRTHVGPPV